MNTKMNVDITVTPKSRSRELYERLQPFKANVTDLGDKVFVDAEIDIREDTIEKIINICHEYGDCDIRAQMK